MGCNTTATMKTISAVELSEVAGGYTMPSGESAGECTAHTLSMAAAAGGAARFAQWALRRGRSNGYLTATAALGGGGFGSYRFCVANPFASKK